MLNAFQWYLASVTELTLVMAECFWDSFSGSPLQLGHAPQNNYHWGSNLTGDSKSRRWSLTLSPCLRQAYQRIVRLKRGSLQQSRIWQNLRKLGTMSDVITVVAIILMVSITDLVLEKVPPQNETCDFQDCSSDLHLCC